MQNPQQPDNGPDPARSYERAKPEMESGMGRLDNNDDATPTDRPNQLEDTVPNRQDPQKQINAEETDDDRAGRDLNNKDDSSTNPEQPEHSMREEEPLGWDQAPQDITDPRHKRHSRTEGRGGTP